MRDQKEEGYSTEKVVVVFSLQTFVQLKVWLKTRRRKEEGEEEKRRRRGGGEENKGIVAPRRRLGFLAKSEISAMRCDKRSKKRPKFKRRLRWFP